MQQIPVGDLVKIMDRGVITIPARYRKQLGLKKGEMVNIFPVSKEALIVMPISITLKKQGADWTKDTVEEYMKKVRYNLVEKFRTEWLKHAW